MWTGPLPEPHPPWARPTGLLRPGELSATEFPRRVQMPALGSAGLGPGHPGGRLEGDRTLRQFLAPPGPAHPSQAIAEGQHCLWAQEQVGKATSKNNVHFLN